MRQVMVAAAALLVFAAVSAGAEDHLVVPGKRIVVIQPGDVVVQAADLPKLGTFHIQVFADGSATVEPAARLMADGGEGVAKADMNPFLTIPRSGATCYRSFDGTNFTQPCDGTTGHGTIRFIEITGTWNKQYSVEDPACTWAFVLNGIQLATSPASPNVQSLGAITYLGANTCGEDPGYPCYGGECHAVHIALVVNLITESPFALWVDFQGTFDTNQCIDNC